MAHRRGAFRSNNRGSRRQSVWLDVPPTATTVTAAGGTIINSLTAAELARRPFTIVRVHMEYHIQSDQVAASEFGAVAAGFAVVTEEALAAGVGSVPTPVSDDDSDRWFLHKYMMESFLFATSIGFDDNSGVGYTVESKAMRRVEFGDEVIHVIELASAISGGGMIVAAAGRVLILES